MPSMHKNKQKKNRNKIMENGCNYNKTNVEEWPKRIRKKIQKKNSRETNIRSQILQNVSILTNRQGLTFEGWITKPS